MSRRFLDVETLIGSSKSGPMAYPKRYLMLLINLKLVLDEKNLPNALEALKCIDMNKYYGFSIKADAISDIPHSLNLPPYIIS